MEYGSFGKGLVKAESQAFCYYQDLALNGRTKEIPRYVIVSDFARIALHDRDREEQTDLPLFEGRRVAMVEFPLADFHRHRIELTARRAGFLRNSSVHFRVTSLIRNRQCLCDKSVTNGRGRL